MHAVAPSDAQQQDTYFIVAHLHYVLFGGSIFGIMAGIYYWFPKASGRLLNETLGKINFWLMFLGMNITFFPMHFLGMDGMPRRQYSYDSSYGWDLWNLVATAGSLLLALSVLVFLHNFFWSVRKGEIAGADPWDGRTLEWSIPSPPPEYNFLTIPIVHDRDAFWDDKQKRGGSLVPEGGSGEGGYGSEDHHGIHMPSPSYWPLVIAIGLTIAAYGMIYNYGVAAFGAAVTMVGIYAWSLEPAAEPEEDKATGDGE